MVTGAMAMAIYSIPRMTRDIDLIIDILPANVEKLVQLFADDCYIDEESVRDAVCERDMFNIIHNQWIVKADFIIRKDEVYRLKKFTRRQKVNIEGTDIFVVTPEDLILLKLVWSKDFQSALQLRDVRQMLDDILTLDLKYVEQWAITLGVEKLLKKVKENERYEQKY